jgi:hypothetical protein
MICYIFNLLCGHLSFGCLMVTCAENLCGYTFLIQVTAYIRTLAHIRESLYGTIEYWLLYGDVWLSVLRVMETQ